MKVSDLKKALQRTNVVGSKSNIAVLNSVVIEHDRIWRTNMEATVSVAIDTGVNNRCIPNASQLAKILGALKPSDEISLTEGEGGSVQVTSRLGKTTLPATYDLADVPDILVRSMGAQSVPGDFYDRLVAVSKFASSDEARPVLMCTRIVADGNSIEIVATDSYSLAKDSLVSNSVFEIQAIMNHYLKCLDTISFVSVEDEKYVNMVGAGVSVQLRNVEGQYPNHEKLIPEMSVFDGVISGDIVDSLKFINKLQPSVSRWESSTPVHMTINSKAKLSWKLQDGPSHESKHYISEASYSKFDEDFVIGYISDFLLKCLDFAGFHGKWISPLRPTMFGDRDGKCALLMPVRLHG